MAKSSIYQLLENPLVYRLSQLLFAPGADYFLNRALKNLKGDLTSSSGLILDVGCGPSSWLWKLGLDPVGLDILHSYSIPFHRHGTGAVTGSATELPFTTDSFETVFTLGVLHHLDDEQVAHVLSEMMRVCKIGGVVVVMDAVLPRSTYIRPFARLVRRMDRGEYMRNQGKLQSLLPDVQNWQTRRYTYTISGLEMLECVYEFAKD